MIDRALVVSLHIATACVLVSHVTSELEIWITRAHIGWTEARLRDYNQHLRVAVWKLAFPYAVW